MSVFEEKTNENVVKILKEENKFFLSYPYKREFYKVVNSDEKIILRSQPAWFIEINDELRHRCFSELAATRFSPKLNIKNTEQEIEKQK